MPTSCFSGVLPPAIARRARWRRREREEGEVEEEEEGEVGEVEEEGEVEKGRWRRRERRQWEARCDDDNDVDDVFLFSQAPHAWISACCLAGGPAPLCRGYHQGGRQHVRLSSSHLRTHASSLSGVWTSTRNCGDRIAHLPSVLS